MKYLLFFLTLSVITACGIKKAFIPTPKDQDFASARFPGTELQDLQEGQILYTDNCKKCHSLKRPEKYSETQWDEIIPEMAKKAKINKTTEEKIYRYVITLCNR